MYTVRGRSAATSDHAIAALWNPHATHRIKVVSFAIFKQGGAGAAGDSVRLRRITTRGSRVRLSRRDGPDAGRGGEVVGVAAEAASSGARHHNVIGSDTYRATINRRGEPVQPICV